MVRALDSSGGNLAVFGIAAIDLGFNHLLHIVIHVGKEVVSDFLFEVVDGHLILGPIIVSDALFIGHVDCDRDRFRVNTFGAAAWSGDQNRFPNTTGGRYCLVPNASFLAVSSGDNLQEVA